MLLNCGAGEDSRVPWTARRSNQSILKEIKNLSKKKSPRLDGFTGESFQAFKEWLTPILLKFFQEIKAEKILSNLFYKSSITLI